MAEYMGQRSYNIRKKHKYVVGSLSMCDDTERVPRWQGSTPSSVCARSEPVPGVDDRVDRIPHGDPTRHSPQRVIPHGTCVANATGVSSAQSPLTSTGHGPWSLVM